MTESSMVYDVLSQNQEAQRLYRTKQEFREVIDAMDACLRTAKETLTRDEYVRFVCDELPRLSKEAFDKSR